MSISTRKRIGDQMKISQRRISHRKIRDKHALRLLIALLSFRTTLARGNHSINIHQESATHIARYGGIRMKMFIEKTYSTATTQANKLSSRISDKYKIPAFTLISDFPRILQLGASPQNILLSGLSIFLSSSLSN